MALGLFLVRIVVSLILVTAGWAKARDRAAFVSVVASLGVPGPLTGPTASAVPWIEMATGVALLWNPTAPWAAVAAVVLLAVFSAVLGIALARGSTAECGCFGGLAVTKVSWKLVIRNVALILLLLPVIFPADP